MECGFCVCLAWNARRKDAPRTVWVDRMGEKGGKERVKDGFLNVIIVLSLSSCLRIYP